MKFFAQLDEQFEVLELRVAFRSKSDLFTLFIVPVQCRKIRVCCRTCPIVLSFGPDCGQWEAFLFLLKMSWHSLGWSCFSRFLFPMATYLDSATCVLLIAKHKHFLRFEQRLAGIAM